MNDKNRNDALAFYIDHLRLMRELDVWAPLQAIDIAIIQRVALENQRDGVCVSDVLAWRDLQSPATMHRRLSALIKSGWLVQRRDHVDRRVAHVELGEKAESAFKNAGQVLAQIGKQ